MARPTSATTINRPELGALAFEYMIEASQRGFIGMEVLPVFRVQEQSGQYPKIPLEAILKLPNTRRQTRANYPRSDWEFETGTFDCEEYGFEEVIDDAEAALYSRFFDAEEAGTQIAIDHILRDHEKRVAALVQNTANAVGNTNVTVEWSTAATATPKADVKAGIQSMRGASGLSPNAVVMSKKVFENVMVTDEIKNYLQYTSPHLLLGAQAQADTLARYFEVDRVLIGGEIYDSAKKGAAATIADLWDDEYVALMKLSSGGNNLREPAFGRTFLWETDAPDPVVVETYRDEPVRGDVVRVRQNVDEAIVFVGANYLLGNITV